MPKKASKVNEHPLLGIWEHRHFPAKWIISILNGKLMVDGVDSSNWEKYKISHLSWTNTALKFTSLYPSTRRVVSNTCTALPKRRMKMVLCYEVTEIWSRSAADTVITEGTSLLDGRSRKHWLIGTWHNPEGDDFRVMCRISFNNNRWHISGEDTGDSERLRVTAIRWNGRSLSFRTTMSSTGQVCHRTFMAISPDKLKVVLRFKEPEHWERLENSDKGSTE